MGEHLWAAAILGGSAAPTSGGRPTSASHRPLHGFVITWIRPSYDGGGVDVALVVMAAALALTVFAARRHPGDDSPIRLLAVVAAAAAVAALVIGQTTIVPGLLIACPLVLVGLLASRRSTGRGSTTTTASLAAGTFAGFAIAVIATQYGTGGSGEWGGRYFAIGLPLLVPVCLLNLQRIGEALPAATRRLATGALLVCVTCLSTMGIGGLRATDQFSGRLNAGWLIAPPAPPATAR